MSQSAVPVLKFVGTISLGLLTGISYTTSTQSIPALLTLPTASTAQTTLATHKRSTTRHLSALFAIAVSSYTAAFALAPPRGGRHPYLLWTSLVASLGWGAAEYLLRTDDKNVRKVAAEMAKREEEFRAQESKDAGIEESYVDAGIGASVADLRESRVGAERGAATEMNGEVVRTSMEQWRVAEFVRLGATGAAFALAVVGLWGDGSAARVVRA